MKHPLSQANIFSRISFAWLIKTFLNGYRRELTESDLFPPLERYNSSFLYARIRKHWQNEIIEFKKKPGSRPSLLRVMVKSFGIQMMMQGMLLLIVDAGTRLCQPFLIVKLLSYFSNNNKMMQAEAASWAAVLLLSLFIQAFFMNRILNKIMFIGMKVRIALSCLIYKKILKTSMISMEKDTTLGQIINLITNDVNNIKIALSMIHYLWIAPIQAVAVMYLLWKCIGLPAVVGTCFFFIFLPIQVYCGMMAPRLSRKAASKTDKRLRLINEIVNCVQVIKMFAWEKSFAPLVQDARKEEMEDIKKTNMMKLNASTSFANVSRFALLISLLLCITFDQYNITGENVFLLTALFNGLQTTMCGSLPNSMQQVANAAASMRRIEDFMTHDNIRYNNKPNNQQTVVKMNCNKTRTETVCLENISARWSPETKEEALRNINFVAKCGSLTSVIGQVGSGKSTLLHVILHELPTITGSVNLVGKIAYVSQEPWIFNSSIRKNILFNLPMEKARYEQVVKVCQLERDFSLFPHSDQTIIGEKGITLSGGQKARVALARAVYQDADIYLLDDPLSAVDTRVGRLIFETCICNFLKNKTRILVTHQLQYLKDVDYIYVFNEGRVEREGTYQEVKESLGNLLVDDGEESVADGIDQKFRVDDFLESGSIISEKVQQEVSEADTFGRTSRNVFLAYLKSVGNIWLILLYIICIVAKQSVLSGAEYTISNWATLLESCGTRFPNTTDLQLSSVNCPEIEHDSWWYVYIYSGLLVTAVILSFVEMITICEICKKASQGLHATMFYAIIRGAMSFFYKNSAGRILNRFSKDLGAVDKDMPKCLNDVIRIILNIVAVMILCFIVNYWFIFGITFSSIIYVLGIRFYSKTSQSLKRLDATTRSPVVKQFTESFHGLTTIRACRAEVFLTEEFQHHQDIQTSASCLYLHAVCAFRQYTDMIALAFIVIISYMFVLSENKNTIGNVGLILTQTIGLYGLIRLGTFQFIELESYETSVERICEFSYIQQEPSLETSPEKMPSKDWPQEGCVEFKNVSLKYYPDDDPVLKNLSFIVQPKEKIGIVGRTGAGKSSLVAALFRLVHIEGDIIIDEVSTADLGLYDLRSKISIIPQQPLLFSGSLRRNLDPFEEYSDDVVWQALEDVELKKAVADLADGLVTQVSDGGLNFSLGQRQLLCLARAIVKQNRILVLDEATANVDAQTDFLIQKTIRKRFEDSTVFIIAHRLNTIMDCDKCMVIDAGRIVEFDEPSSLLDKKEGFFYDMVQQTGTETSSLLTKMSQRTKV